jgi:hypothetical protein
LGYNHCIDGIVELVLRDWLAIMLTKVSFSEEDPWQTIKPLASIIAASFSAK